MNKRYFHRGLLCLVLAPAAFACVFGSTPAAEDRPAEDVTASPAATNISPTPTIPPSTPTRSPTATPLAPITIVNEACANLVLETLDAAQQKCGERAEGSVCLAGNPVEVVPTSADFTQPGDTLPLESLQLLHTGQVDLTENAWGAALIRLPAQANGASGSLMLVGDVTLNTVAGADPPSFWVNTSSNPPQCPGAPNALILNTPEEKILALTINGVSLSAEGATAVISATLDGEMTVMVLSGSVTAVAQDVSQTVEIGQMISLTLGGDNALEAVAPPTEPTIFDTEQIEFVPFHVIHSPIEILSGQRWTNTGIQLQTGQVYMIIAAGLMKTVDTLPWSSPTGHSAADCAAAGRSDWDCRCRTLPEWGTCTLSEVPSMTLVGRIGGVQPFIVGAGGVFTAKVDGELELGPNDNYFDDNLATYHAIVVVLGSEMP
ncbi:MAG: hypothetical protein JXB30_14315 [Anaerolineae bacterium]|nr:hypothetical protein [Anaerolineae bacterium]